MSAVPLCHIQMCRRYFPRILHRRDELLPTHDPRKGIGACQQIIDTSAAQQCQREENEFELGNLFDLTEEGPGHNGVSSETILQKVQLFTLGTFSKSNRILRMMERPLIFLSFTMISYSSSCYGSNLVWFNVLNATVSLVLTEKYNFSASVAVMASGESN
jgi:hypothetical protein